MKKLETNFLDKNKPTMNELLFWFQVNYPHICDEMNECKHSFVTDEPNPYHCENSAFAHTMLVCQRAEIACEIKYNKIPLITAMLHDIGKVEAREVIDFEAKKPVHNENNEIRIVPPSAKKTRFAGHEGISFYKSIEIINALQEKGVINQKEKEDILTIISMHGTLFDNITEDGEMKKEFKVFDKFKDVELFNNYIQQVRNDSLGRFFTSKDGRKNNAYRLGTEIFTEAQFIDYKQEQAAKVLAVPEDNKNKPWIEVLIGVAGSGKSTYLKDRLYLPEPVPVIISRDDTLMEFAHANEISGNYSEIWKSLTDEDQSNIDKLLEDKFKKAFKNKQNMVIDMTNMSNKSQRKWTNKANAPKSYRAKATIFATSYNEVTTRLKKREQETGKSIPDFVVKNMMKGFMVPNYTNFSEISWVF